jgi:hypothetical protein
MAKGRVVCSIRLLVGACHFELNRRTRSCSCVVAPIQAALLLEKSQLIIPFSVIQLRYILGTRIICRSSCTDLVEHHHDNH